MSAPWRVAALLVLLAAVPAPGLAQQEIRGRLVDDENLRPVTEAQVTLLREGERLRTATTDSAGAFLLQVPDPGEYALEARRLGYETTVSQPFEVRAGDELNVEFRVLPDAILLAPLTVTGRNRGSDIFYRRMDEWGRGIFVEPAEVDSVVRWHPGDVFRDREDVQLVWDHAPYRGRVPRVWTQRGRGCLRYMLNRVPIRGDAPPWDRYPMQSILPGEIAAVEIYRSYQEVPPELRFHAHPDDVTRPPCGLVVFWTKGPFD